jgi:hypothetical protein
MIKKWGHTSMDLLPPHSSFGATTLSIMTFSLTRLSVVVLSVVMLNAVTLSVMAPLRILFVYNLYVWSFSLAASILHEGILKGEVSLYH